MSVAEIETVNTRETSWIQGVAAVLRLTERRADPRLRTNLSCHARGETPAFFLPPDMSSLQPDSLRYLHAMARRNRCRLIEDRRDIDIQPIVEQRNQKPSALALGVSLLLQQTGLPGPVRCLSTPHRLNPDSQHIPVHQLIEVAAFAAPKSKRVVVLPNKHIVDALGNDTRPIAGHACKLVTLEATTVMSYFESVAFRAIGYRTSGQFVVHVFLGGGPLRAPQLWANTHTLTNSAFRFQLFHSKHPGHDFGLLYSTQYLDLDSSAEQAPWWNDNLADVRSSTTVK